VKDLKRKKRPRISAIVRARAKVRKRVKINPFHLPDFPPGVLPAGNKGMAMDQQVGSSLGWAAGSWINAAFTQGYEFLGYTYLAELAQVPEYRRIVEVIATEMTRKWIKLSSVGDDDKTKQIEELEDEMKRLQVKETFRRIAEQDGFFGRAHLYLDTGSTDNPDELKTPIGDGRDKISEAKIEQGSLKRLKTVEALWCYPTNYNANDPLKPDWYNPEMWFVMGKEIHSSRLLTFVGREVPDLLKPAYSFGGLALTQMAKPYVDNWLRTRQSVSDLVGNFSVRGVKTDLGESLMSAGDELFARAEVFNDLADNQGLMLLQNGAPGEGEDFFNITTPLGGLYELQAQAQEHMAAVSGIPLVKLLGIQPAGLNASSEGEIRVWYDWIEAYQEKLFTEKLGRVIDFIQLSLWGKVDPAITFTYEKLFSLTEKEAAEVREIDARTADINIGAGVLWPLDERTRIAHDPLTLYPGLDVNDLPEAPEDPKINIRGTEVAPELKQGETGEEHEEAA
jgi:uncharacterized protein